MIDITTIPVEELYRDRIECDRAITLCNLALTMELDYLIIDGERVDVSDYRRDNIEVIRRINVELARREEEKAEAERRARSTKLVGIMLSQIVEAISEGKGNAT